MTNQPAQHNFRENIAIAIDGGGIKGIIVAHALIELEQMLGVERLIDAPQLKVISGTSTGALLAFGIAAGMTGAELVEVYTTLGEVVFSKPGPFAPLGNQLPIPYLPTILLRLFRRLPASLRDFALYPLFPARYSFDPLRETLANLIASRPAEFMPNANPTLRELGLNLEKLRDPDEPNIEKRDGTTLIFTATEISGRETHFLKTSAYESFPHMKVVDAVLASSAIPTYWEPVALPTEDNPPRLLVDGGVGVFGNPAFVAAWEMCDRHNRDPRRHYDPEKTTVISFGTGTYTRDEYRKLNHDPRKWWALQWVQRVPDLFGDNAIREQSRNIVYTYPGIDLRRFQVPLTQKVGADSFHLVDKVLIPAGKQMQQLVKEDRHALRQNLNDRNDPEGISTKGLDFLWDD